MDRNRLDAGKSMRYFRSKLWYRKPVVNGLFLSLAEGFLGSSFKTDSRLYCTSYWWHIFSAPVLTLDGDFRAHTMGKMSGRRKKPGVYGIGDADCERPSRKCSRTETFTVLMNGRL